MRRWKSVSKPPKRSMWVMVCFDDENAPPEIAHYNSLKGYEGFHSAYDESLLPTVTHWMKLPKVPCNQYKNYPLFVVVVMIMWLVCWAVSSTVVGCMAWAIGSDFTFLNSVAVATGFWALLCGGALLISKVDDDFR